MKPELQSNIVDNQLLHCKAYIEQKTQLKSELHVLFNLTLISAPYRERHNYIVHSRSDHQKLSASLNSQQLKRISMSKNKRVKHMKQMQVFSLNQHLFTTKYGTEHTFDYKMHSSRTHKITTNKCVHFRNKSSPRCILGNPSYL